MPINVLLKPAEIAFHLQDAEAAAYFCFEGTPELPMAAMGKAAFDEVGHLPPLRGDAARSDAAAGHRRRHHAGVVRDGHGRRDAHTEPTAPDDTAVILYTSGTTGQPKGAELTHLNIVLNATSSSDILVVPCRIGLHEPVVSLITLPLFHSFGQVCQLVSGIHSGNTLVLVPRFEPRAVVATMLAERVNLWCGVPTMYWALMDLLRHEDASVDLAALAAHMRLCVSGGAPMPVGLLEEVSSRLGVRILEGYGLSETSPVATFNHPERPSKPGTVGQPIFGVEVECVSDDGVPVPDGERGEVVIRGPNIMKGYFRQPEATADVLRGGWFHTGDIGVIDADGYLAIVDRKKDMILRGGFNVYPREIEELLLTHPAVGQCAVVGDPRRAARRGRQGVRRPQAGPGGDRGRDRHLVPRADRRLQGAALRRVHRGAADERDRQGAQARAARRRRRHLVINGRRVRRRAASAGAAARSAGGSDAIGSLRNRISGAAARKIASSVG